MLGLRFEYRDAEGRAVDRAVDVSSVLVELTVRADGALDPRPRVYAGLARLRER